jgi:hypothetical protein
MYAKRYQTTDLVRDLWRTTVLVESRGSPRFRLKKPRLGGPPFRTTVVRLKVIYPLRRRMYTIANQLPVWRKEEPRMARRNKASSVDRVAKGKSKAKEAGKLSGGQRAEKAAKSAAKPKAPKRAKRTTKKKVDSGRLRLVWGVFDNSNQQVATFPFPERRAAEEKAAQLTEKGRGEYFVQPVKESIPATLEDDRPARDKD